MRHTLKTHFLLTPRKILASKHKYLMQNKKNKSLHYWSLHLKPDEFKEFVSTPVLLKMNTWRSFNLTFETRCEMKPIKFSAEDGLEYRKQ